MKPAHVHRPDPNALSAKTRAALSAKPAASYVSPKRPGAAPPPTRSWEPAPAHNPDLAWPVVRPGADDGLAVQSIGDAT